MILYSIKKCLYSGVVQGSKFMFAYLEKKLRGTLGR